MRRRRKSAAADAIRRATARRMAKEGLSIREVARRIGISHTGLAAILRGADSQIGTWARLAEFAGLALDASPREVRGGE